MLGAKTATYFGQKTAENEVFSSSDHLHLGYFHRYMVIAINNSLECCQDISPKNEWSVGVFFYLHHSKVARKALVLPLNKYIIKLSTRNLYALISQFDSLSWQSEAKGSLLAMDSGIRLIEAPRSTSAPLGSRFPIFTERLYVLRSRSFVGIFHYRMKLAW